MYSQIPYRRIPRSLQGTRPIGQIAQRDVQYVRLFIYLKIVTGVFNVVF